MPLKYGKSPKSFVSNVKAEMNAGKPQKQALAIAYAVKRKAKARSMARGGMVEEEKEDDFLTADMETPFESSDAYCDDDSEMEMPQGENTTDDADENKSRKETLAAIMRRRMRRM